MRRTPPVIAVSEDRPQGVSEIITVSDGVALGGRLITAVSEDRPQGVSAITAVSRSVARGVRPIIAVARDEAFCFLYEENIEILRECGAEICCFSPLNDASVPYADAIYLPGGYPELYLERLSQNKHMLKSIREAVGRGTPTIAECGGFMYLHREIDGFAMVGIIEGKAYRTERLRRFGYIHIKAKKGNLLCRAGEGIRSHEFHYYDSTSAGSDFEVKRARGGEPYQAGIATESMYAGFPHLYLGANRVFAENFVEAARRFAKNR